MTDQEIINLYKKFEESVWKFADACEKGTKVPNVKVINKAKNNNVKIGAEILTLMLGRKPTEQELASATEF